MEELTDVSPLQNAVTQLPESIYEIVEQYEHVPVVSAKYTDDLIYNISKTYFYSVIESLCKLIKPEATVEEGLADYFSNPSHRTTDPILQQPVEAEEDWVILHLLGYLNNHLYHNLIKLQGLREDKDISNEEEKGGDKIEETETSTVIIVIISINYNTQYNSKCLKSKETEIKINIKNINLIQKKW